MKLIYYIIIRISLVLSVFFAGGGAPFFFFFMGHPFLFCCNG